MLRKTLDLSRNEAAMLYWAQRALFRRLGVTLMDIAIGSDSITIEANYRKTVLVVGGKLTGKLSGRFSARVDADVRNDRHITITSICVSRSPNYSPSNVSLRRLSGFSKWQREYRG